MHHLNEVDGFLPAGTVVVQTEEIGRMVGDAVHEILNPFLTVGVVGAGRRNEFFALVAAQREHLFVPDIRCLLRGDAGAFGLVEEEDDVVLGIDDVVPFPSFELDFAVDHGSERSASFEFGRGPGVPITDGGDGAFEVDFIHGPRDARMAGTVGIGPVWNQD